MSPSQQDASEDEFFDEPVDPDRLTGCEYWRCGDIFERRTTNQIFCRKACRSRQRKWERAQARKQLRAERKLRLLLTGLILGAVLAACASGSSDPQDTISAPDPINSSDLAESTPIVAQVDDTDDDPATPVDPTASAIPVPVRPTSVAVASNIVPTLEEFEEMGISAADAECFIAEIDPDGTGVITDENLFLDAFALCLG